MPDTPTPQPPPPPPTRTAAADLVAVQPGAVVSRTLLKHPGGSVTAFAFDAGQGLSEHTAPFDALVLILDGTATISIDGQPHTLTPGQTILMPAGIPHALQAPQALQNAPHHAPPLSHVPHTPG